MAAAARKYKALGAKWSELAAAALPPHVAMLGEARSLLETKAEMLNSEQDTSEIEGCWKRLEALKRAASSEFPLSAAESAELRTQLADRVLEIHGLETDALGALKTCAA